MVSGGFTGLAVPNSLEFLSKKSKCITRTTGRRGVRQFFSIQLKMIASLPNETTPHWRLSKDSLSKTKLHISQFLTNLQVKRQYRYADYIIQSYLEIQVRQHSKRRQVCACADSVRQI